MTYWEDFNGPIGCDACGYADEAKVQYCLMTPPARSLARITAVCSDNCDAQLRGRGWTDPTPAEIEAGRMRLQSAEN